MKYWLLIDILVVFSETELTETDVLAVPEFVSAIDNDTLQALIDAGEPINMEIVKDAVKSLE